MDSKNQSGARTEKTDRIEQSQAGAASSRRFEHLFENLQDAVVEFEIVDDTPVVREVNPAFVEVFGYRPEEMQDRSLNECIVPDVYADEARTFDTRTHDGKHNKAVVRRETADGLRRFLYRGIPYERPDGRSFGFAIYSDITDETRREHRLQVLHRILRHNLRNNLNVIDGLAEEVARNNESPAVADSAREIQAQAADLNHISTEASRVERILDRTGNADAVVDVARVCERVVEEYRPTYVDADIDLDVPESLEVSASTHIELALQQLVENAVEHNDSTSPAVRVSAEQTTGNAHDWVDVQVADDGPPIPTDERQIIRAESAPDQLSHGSGLGLRLVQWITDAAGGTVSIEQSALGGNVVTLRFKRSDG